MKKGVIIDGAIYADSGDIDHDVFLDLFIL